MASLIKFIFYVSIVIFLAILFFCYYQFPEFVSVGYSDNVAMKAYKSKVWLFYSFGGVFLVFNVLIVILKKLMESMPFSLIGFPSKSFWLQDLESREALVKVFVSWFNSLTAIFNLFIAGVIFMLFLVNVVEFKDFGDYMPFIYAGLALLGLWWIILPIRLSYKKLEL